MPGAPPLVPLPGVPEGVREGTAVVAIAIGCLLAPFGLPVGGVLLTLAGGLLLAPATLRAPQGWTGTGERWVAVTSTELRRAVALMEHRARWARDPWHAARRDGLVILAGVLMLAGIGLLLARQALDPQVVLALAAAIVAAVVPPFVFGARRLEQPPRLAADLARAADLCDTAEAAPDPAWQPVPELWLSDAADDEQVPHGARVRLVMPAAPPALLDALVEGANGTDSERGTRVVLRVRGAPGVREAVARAGDAVDVAAGADHLRIVIPPGPRLFERLGAVLDELSTATGPA